MKKVYLLLIAAGCLFVSCSNSKDSSSDKDKTEKKKVSKDDDEDKPKDDEDDQSANIEKVANGICDCMSEGVDGLSSKSKKIIVKAGNSDNPTQTMQSELMKIEDPEEKQQIAQEFTEFGKLAQGNEMEDCAKKLEKKYHVDDKDPRSQKLLIKQLASDDRCSVIAALMNIGFKTQGKNTEE